MGASGLGPILVKEGLLTQEDRITIRKTSGQCPGAFAKGVLALGLLDEDELVGLLADRTSFRLANKDLNSECDRQAFTAIDMELFARLEVVPLDLTTQTLTVAMFDPLDKAVIRQLEFFTGLRIKPVIATLSKIRETLLKFVPGYKPSHSSLELFLMNHVDSAARQLRISGAVKEETPTASTADFNDITFVDTDFSLPNTAEFIEDNQTLSATETEISTDTMGEQSLDEIDLDIESDDPDIETLQGPDDLDITIADPASDKVVTDVTAAEAKKEPQSDQVIQSNNTTQTSSMSNMNIDELEANLNLDLDQDLPSDLDKPAETAAAPIQTSQEQPIQPQPEADPEPSIPESVATEADTEDQSLEQLADIEPDDFNDSVTDAKPVVEEVVVQAEPAIESTAQSDSEQIADLPNTATETTAPTLETNSEAQDDINSSNLNLQLDNDTALEQDLNSAEDLLDDNLEQSIAADALAEVNVEQKETPLESAVNINAQVSEPKTAQQATKQTLDLSIFDKDDEIKFDDLFDNGTGETTKTSEPEKQADPFAGLDAIEHEDTDLNAEEVVFDNLPEPELAENELEDISQPNQPKDPVNQSAPTKDNSLSTQPNEPSVDDLLVKDSLNLADEPTFNSDDAIPEDSDLFTALDNELTNSDQQKKKPKK